MADLKLRFKVNAEMEQALQQRKIHLAERLKDAEQFESQEEIARFSKQRKVSSQIVTQEHKQRQKEQGILLQLPELKTQVPPVSPPQEDEPAEDSSEIDVIEHAEIPRVTFQQELEYLRNRAMMEREDKAYYRKLEQAEAQRSEYKLKTAQARYQICNQLLEELLCKVCGSIDKEAALDAFNGKMKQIESLFPLYNERFQVCIAEKDKLLRQYLYRGTFYGEAAIEENADIFDFYHQIFEKLNRPETELIFSLSDQLGIQENPVKSDFYPLPFVRLVCNDETLAVDFKGVQLVVGEENLFYLQGLDQQAMQGYKTYFGSVNDQLKQAALALKPKAGAKGVPIAQPARQIIELDDSLMIIPTIETDKFIKTATVEQIAMARMQYLVYRRAGLVAYWVFEQMQLSQSCRSISEHEFVAVNLTNEIALPVYMTVYTSIKGVKGLSEIEQAFAFINSAKLKLQQIYKLFNYQDVQADAQAPNPSSKPTTPKRDGKRSEPVDAFRQNIEATVKSKFTTVYQSAFDEIIYICKNNVYRLQQSAGQQKPSKGKAEVDYVDYLAQEIEQKSLFYYRDFQDVQVVEQVDESFVYIQGMYKTDLLRLLSVRYAQFPGLCRPDLHKIAAGTLQDLSGAGLGDFYAYLPGAFYAALQRMAQADAIDVCSVAGRLPEGIKIGFLRELVYQFYVYIRYQYQEILFALHLLMKILCQKTLLINIFGVSTIVRNFDRTIAYIKQFGFGPVFTAAQRTQINDELHEMRHDMLAYVEYELQEQAKLPCIGAEAVVLQACNDANPEMIEYRLGQLLSFIRKYFLDAEIVNEFSLSTPQHNLADAVVSEAAYCLDRFLVATVRPFLLFSVGWDILFNEKSNLQEQMTTYALLDRDLAVKLAFSPARPQAVDDIFTDILRKSEIFISSRALQNAVFQLAMVLKFDVENAQQRVVCAAKQLYLLCLQTVQNCGQSVAEMENYFSRYRVSLVCEYTHSTAALKSIREHFDVGLDVSAIYTSFNRISKSKTLFAEVTDFKTEVILHPCLDISQFIEKCQIDAAKTIDSARKACFVVVKEVTTAQDTNPKAKKGAVVESCSYRYYKVPLLAEINASLARLTVPQFYQVIALLDHLTYALAVRQTPRNFVYPKADVKKQKDQPVDEVKEEVVIARFGDTEAYRNAQNVFSKPQSILGSAEETAVWFRLYFELFSDVMIDVKQQTLMLLIALLFLPVETYSYEQKLEMLLHLQPQRALALVRNRDSIRDVLQLLWRPEGDNLEISNVQSLFCDVSSQTRAALNEIVVQEDYSPKLSSRKMKK